MNKRFLNSRTLAILILLSFIGSCVTALQITTVNRDLTPVIQLLGPAHTDKTIAAIEHLESIDEIKRFSSAFIKAGANDHKQEHELFLAVIDNFQKSLLILLLLFSATIGLCVIELLKHSRKMNQGP